MHGEARLFQKYDVSGTLVLQLQHVVDEEQAVYLYNVGNQNVITILEQAGQHERTSNIGLTWACSIFFV